METRRKMMEFLRQYIAQNNYSPTYKEIAEYVGVSIVTIHFQVKRLMMLGKIDYTPHKVRSIRL